MMRSKIKFSEVFNYYNKVMSLQQSWNFHRYENCKWRTTLNVGLFQHKSEGRQQLTSLAWVRYG